MRAPKEKASTKLASPSTELTGSIKSEALILPFRGRFELVVQP